MGADTRTDLRIRKKQIKAALSKMDKAIRSGNPEEAHQHWKEAINLRKGVKIAPHEAKAAMDFERTVDQEIKRLAKSYSKIKRKDSPRITNKELPG